MLQKAKFVLRACALAGLMALPATGRGETPQQASERLMTNYRAMVTRNILVSPIPKHLNFYQAPLKLEQLVLVVLKTTEYTDIAVMNSIPGSRSWAAAGWRSIPRRFPANTI